MSGWRSTPTPHAFRPLENEARRQVARGDNRDPDEFCAVCEYLQDLHSEAPPVDVEMREMPPDVAPRLFPEGL